jgi:hypothetical protein
MRRVTQIGVTALAMAAPALSACLLTSPLYLYTSDGTWISSGTTLSNSAPAQPYAYNPTTAVTRGTGFLTWGWSPTVQGCFVTVSSVSNKDICTEANRG